MAKRVRSWILAGSRSTGCLLWLLFCAQALSAQDRPIVYLRFADSLTLQESDRLASSIVGQVEELAQIVRADASGDVGLCTVLMGRTPQGLTVRFASAADGVVGPPRVLGALSDELSASEAATVVRAYVVAQVDRLATQPPAPSAPDANARAANERSPLAARATEPGTRTEAAVPSSRPTREARKTRASLASEADTTSEQPLPSALARVWLSALYTGTAYAPQLPWHSGARLEASLRLDRWLHVGLGYAFEPAVDLVSELMTVRVLAHGLHALAAVSRTRQRYGLSAELAAALTEVRRTTTRVVEPLARTENSASFSPSLLLRLRARLRMPGVSRFWLEFAPALQWVPRTRELAVMAEREIAILTPRSLRPRLDVGVSFDVL